MNLLRNLRVEPISNLAPVVIESLPCHVLTPVHHHVSARNVIVFGRAVRTMEEMGEEYSVAESSIPPTQQERAQRGERMEEGLTTDQVRNIVGAY